MLTDKIERNTPIYLTGRRAGSNIEISSIDFSHCGGTRFCLEAEQYAPTRVLSRLLFEIKTIAGAELG
jgi:hypothetical protein